MEWMFLPLRRYAQFNGRSRRMEYWMWTLFTVIAAFVLGILDFLLGFSNGAAGAGAGAGSQLRNGLLGNVFSLATFLPSLAATVRRLHDTNRSGWWVLLPVIPAIAAIVAIFVGAATGGGSILIVGIVAGVAVLAILLLLLVWYCTAGTIGPNDYGDDPKADFPADLQRTFE